jgi:hypothetical protein
MHPFPADCLILNFTVMPKQTTNTILMIEPVAFGFNDQTVVNNYFQHQLLSSEPEVQQQSLAEFKGMVKKLTACGLDVLVVKDTMVPHTPDSIFPNNWISFHEEGRAVLYPMFADNRRKERRSDIIRLVENRKQVVLDVIDYSAFEQQNVFLEGTGSLIPDRVHKIAYAALSERTDKSLLLQFCADFGYKAVFFTANQSVEGKRLPVYHTNVMMCVADRYAVICTAAIDSEEERAEVIDSLQTTGKEIVAISEDQMHHFAGNMLQVENREGKTFLVMSQAAYDSLNEEQIGRLRTYDEFIVVSIPTIERVGGGGARCMMAEVF